MKELDSISAIAARAGKFKCGLLEEYCRGTAYYGPLRISTIHVEIKFAEDHYTVPSMLSCPMQVV
jgi:hypothetical protein